MKQLLFFVLVLFWFAGTAQTLDTIYANEDYNTALFFPAKVRQGIVGSQNYIFSYSEEKPQYFGLLKAVPGTTSNLLVLTQEGRIYSYVLSYRKNLPTFNYFIDSEESIGHEKSTKENITSVREIDTLQSRSDEENFRTRNSVLKRRSQYYLKSSKGEIKIRKKKGLSLAVVHMSYYEDEVYMVLSLKNESGISFEPEYLDVFISRGNKKRNASHQRLLQEPLYTHHFPATIYHLQKKRFVLVFPKFTLVKNEKIELELREKKGSRYLRMKLSHREDLKSAKREM